MDKIKEIFIGTTILSDYGLDTKDETYWAKNSILDTDDGEFIQNTIKKIGINKEIKITIEEL